MPTYEYHCNSCHRNHESASLMNEHRHIESCPFCNGISECIPVLTNLQTDSNFFGTGQYDNRVCRNPDDKIEGRSDWKKRLDQKNLRELDWAEVNKNPPIPKRVFEDER